jgi:hypothetical protein
VSSSRNRAAGKVSAGPGSRQSSARSARAHPVELVDGAEQVTLLVEVDVEHVREQAALRGMEATAAGA